MIRAENISFSYSQQQILREITMDICPGEIIALVGPNGSGKTTLLKVLSAVLKTSRGTVYLNSRDINDMKSREIAQILAAIEQNIEPGFEFSVQEIVALGRISQVSYEKQREQEIIEEAMQKANVNDLRQRPFQALSSGERQRVWLAMALAQQPQILILDEPTSHLDIRYRIELLDLIHNLAKQNMTIVLSIHDLNLAAHYADRIIMMQQGKILAQGTPKQVFIRELLEQVFEVPVDIHYTPQEIPVIQFIPRRIK